MLPFNIRHILSVLIVGTLLHLKAADTLHLNMAQAEELFLKNNYELLAKSFQIDLLKAQEIQAKLIPNPVFTAEFNMYDPQNDRFFHTGSTGQKGFQLEQLLRLGGKRKSEIDLAKSHTGIAELVFYDLVRQLRFQLHNTFYTLSEQNNLIFQYKKRLDMLDSMIVSFDKQVSRGNVPVKDLVRLKTLYINLSNEKHALQYDNHEKMSQLQILLRTNAILIPTVENSSMDKYDKDFSNAEIKQLALENRPDYQATEKNKVLAAQYLAYQKKLARPDVSVFAAYDQRGGAFGDQVNGGISLPLPLFNRNQGAIKMAETQTKISELEQNALAFSIETEIGTSIRIYNESKLQYKKISELYSRDFEFTFSSISANFQKRNVTLLEFVDFFEAYNSTTHEITKAKLQLWVAIGLINYNVSKNLFE